MAKGDTYTALQIAHAAYNAGWRGVDLLKAIAIALAESSGISQDHVNSDGSVDRGPWQINDVHLQGGMLNTQAYDLNQAAQLAHSIYVAKGRTFNDWTTYTGGAYHAFLQQAFSAAYSFDPSVAGIQLTGNLFPTFTSVKSAVGSVPGVPDINLPNPLSGVDAIGEFFGNLRKEQILFRMGLTVGASALILIGMGLYVFGPSSMNPRDSAKTVISVAGTAAKGAML